MSLPLDLAARLWLVEPDEVALEEARACGVAADASPDVVAGGYTALFVLNVYPYGSVFTDPSAELNGEGSLFWARRFEESDFRPQELFSVGAPDHVGLCLKYLWHLEARGAADPAGLSEMLSWVPVCTLAAERDPLAHGFYRLLARATREALLARAEDGLEATAIDARAGVLEGSGENGELRLSDLLSYLMAPARCGFFLSRSSLARIGRRAALPIPFGGRFETARGLFESAGESGGVEGLLDQISGQIDGWEQAYRGTASDWPVWTPWAERWTARLERCRKTVTDLRATVRDFEPSLPSTSAEA